jgi:endo-1,3(4)-beta-glucanase
MFRYFLYASAVLAKIDPSFIDRFGSHVDAIFHDVAHSASGDSRSVGSDKIFFPMTRHKSWFDGHSFATGMFPFGNGKSQESSSEAVNCYYGAYLWSKVRHNDVASDVTDFSLLLLAMEVRSTKTYWHMVPKSAMSNKTDVSTEPHLYPPQFEENYMVGNVGMLDVAANTWFGTDPLYIHMINAIPITAATRLLFVQDYVQYEYPFLMESRSSVEMAWRGYTTSIHAIIDPNKAWDEAKDLISYELDSALSKSQVLYFISQQPGFGVVSDTTSSTSTKKKTELARTSSSSPLSPEPSSSSGPPDTQKLSSDDSLSSTSFSSSACESNPGCVGSGLSGDCCPTAQKVFLDCCSKS